MCVVVVVVFAMPFVRNSVGVENSQCVISWAKRLLYLVLGAGGLGPTKHGVMICSSGSMCFVHPNQ